MRIILLVTLVIMAGMGIAIWQESKESEARLAARFKNAEDRDVQDKRNKERWDVWAGANCTVSGGKLIAPGREVVVYDCANGTSWEAAPGRAPMAWLETVGKSTEQDSPQQHRSRGEGMNFRKAIRLVVSMISAAALFFMWREVIRQLAAFYRAEAVPPGLHAYCEFFNFSAASPSYYAAGFILWFIYAGLATWLVVALSGALLDAIDGPTHTGNDKDVDEVHSGDRGP